MYAATHQAMNSQPLLTEATLADAVTPQSAPGELDLITGYQRRYGTGFLITPSLWADTGPRAYGHDGAGGALGVADPDLGLGFGYLPNQMIFLGRPYQRAGDLLDAACQCAKRK
jgi:CubicO group peptidase (beta-lactamase class C family)